MTRVVSLTVSRALATSGSALVSAPATAAIVADPFCEEEKVKLWLVPGSVASAVRT